MIHHVVMWRLRDDAKQANIEMLTQRLQANVEALRAAVPGLVRLEVASNRASAADAADLVLYSEFESWHALQGYDAHPLHVELRGLIGPLRIERRVVDYET